MTTLVGDFKVSKMKLRYSILYTIALAVPWPNYGFLPSDNAFKFDINCEMTPNECLNAEYFN